MLVFALMIGVVSDTIGARVDDLKRGNAKVLAGAFSPPRRAGRERASPHGKAGGHAPRL